MRMGLGLGFTRRNGGGGGGDVTGPVVTSIVWDTTTDPDNPSLTFTVDEACTLRALVNTSATPLSAAAIQSGAEVTQALAAGIGYLTFDDSAEPAGTLYLHWSVTDGSGNASVQTALSYVKAAPFVANAVRFNGTNTWLSHTGMTSPVASEYGTFGMGFRVPSPWPAGSDYIVNFRKTASAGRFYIRANRNSDGITLDSGRLSISVYDDAGTSDGAFATADFTIEADEWVSLALTYDSREAVQADRWTLRVATGAAAFVTPSAAFTPTLPLNMIVGATANCVVGAEELTGVYFFPAWDLSYLYWAPGQLADITDSAVLAKFRASNGGRLADGSGITGVDPFIFLQGDTAVFQNNLGTGGGFTENGTLTTSAGPLP